MLRTVLVLGILFGVGNKLKGISPKAYLPAFLGLFVLATLVRVISAEYTFNRYLEWAFWALIVGLVISNTVGVPQWLKPAVQTEYYIKAGLVIMGFSVLFSNIINFGLYGLGIAWLVPPIVIIFMWFFGTRVLKIDNKPLVITLSTATSVCGTSAAIAVGAASKAKKTDLSLAVSISIIFTVIMMVAEPIIIRAVGIGELMGGALIGGTVDSTGAVTVAGTALGSTAQTVAVLVKSIQNILIGFIAFAVAVFFTTRVERDSSADSARKIGASEIWYRLPKFILGFFAASLLASFVFLPLAGKESVSSINSVLDQYKKENIKRKFSVSTQHYSFVDKAFVEMVKQFDTLQYEFAILETRTAEVIRDVSDQRSEIGILYQSNFNRKIINKLLRDNGLEFHKLIECRAYVYLWKGHPLAGEPSITLEQLADDPCLSFEQGDRSSSFLAEEILTENEYPRMIYANDRATMLNLMAGLNGYTLCSGIICEELNGTDFIAVPYQEDRDNRNSVMEIGYIKKKGFPLSEIGDVFLQEIRRCLSPLAAESFGNEKMRLTIS